MSVLRHLTGALGRQAFQLEQAAASAAFVQTSHIQTAGIFSAVLPQKQHTLPPTLTPTNPWHVPTSSSSSKSKSSALNWRSQALRSYSQCDCPPLGGPQPDVIVVEYDEEEVDRFIALADAIEAVNPNIVVEGNPEGPGRAGAFEVKDKAGRLLFSRWDDGGWPTAEDVVYELQVSAAMAARNTAKAEDGS